LKHQLPMPLTSTARIVSIILYQGNQTRFSLLNQWRTDGGGQTWLWPRSSEGRGNL